MDNTDNGAAAGAQVLRRLIAARDRNREDTPAARVPTPPAEPVTPERAASTALARAAERAHRLPVFVDKVGFAAVSLAELAEILPERALLAVVEGPRDQLGVVAICPDLLASLIEMQALGRVTTRPTVPRRATRTDAAISEDFVNSLLTELNQSLRDHPGHPAYAGFRYVTYLDDPRPLALMLEDGVMSRLSMEFRIGASGQRSGRLMVALPDTTISARSPAGADAPMLTPPGPVHVPVAPQVADGPTLATVMQQAPLDLSGILCRRTLTLRALRGLGPGSTIPLPQNALEDARIEIGTGQLVARGKLGEAEGFHAIRISAARAATPEGTAPLTGPEEPDPFRVARPADGGHLRAAG